MSSPKALFSLKRYLAEGLEISPPAPRPVFVRKVFHPFPCRLGEEAVSFDITDPKTLTEVGFSCWALGMLTIFRPSFLIIISIIPRIRHLGSNVGDFKAIVLPISYMWMAVVLFVLFGLGLIPILSDKIKKRWVLLIHPWILMVLYLDAIVWLTVTTCLYIELELISPAGESAVRQVYYTPLFILLVYIDILIYFLVYYVFITFYIVAQVTIIERFY